MLKKSITSLINDAENNLNEIFNNIDKQCLKNSEKIINAFHEYNVSESDLYGTSGYGYNDFGREKIESIYSRIFGSEDALVRCQLVSGSHAISISLQALLRQNDTLLTISGKPYNTLHEVIGIKQNDSSLINYGINYKCIDLINNDFDYDKIKKELKSNIKVIHIQRSRGYSQRESININSLKKVVQFIKNISPKTIIFVDNCYCELVEDVSPIEVGCDLCAGSLIKNLGGGITPNGGYICGRKDLISLCAQRLYIPGEGKHVGATNNFNYLALQGLFMSPNAVKNSLKINTLTSYVLNKLNIKVSPKYNEIKSDIVLAIYLNSENEMIKYAECIQNSGAINSFVSPIPESMPGYNNKIIMASPSFIQGSSIELSCDGEIKEPYILFLQGSLTYEYGKLALINILKKLFE